MRTTSPICPTHAITETGRAWTESWSEQPEAVQQAIDFCPYCREENALVFRRQLRIAVLILAGLAAMFVYDWMVGQWRWNPHRTTNFVGDLVGTVFLFDVVIGGGLTGGWFAARGMGDRYGTPEQRWGWLGHKALGVLIVAVLLGAPWVGMAM